LKLRGGRWYQSVTAAAPPGASGKNEPHHIAAAATTNLFPDFYNKIGTQRYVFGSA